MTIQKEVIENFNVDKNDKKSFKELKGLIKLGYKTDSVELKRELYQ